MIENNVKSLMKIFIDNGKNIRIVGGAVRDSLLGIVPKDVDLSTDALPEDVVKILESNGIKTFPTGLQHGTVTAVYENIPYEITTLRKDVDTDGRHSAVEFVCDFEEDALRRDFTINAMSMDIDGTLFDYFGGRQDIINRRLKFVGDAAKRIDEDNLRILRYFRFLDRFEGDGETLETIRIKLSGLAEISVERSWMEFQKILLQKKYQETLQKMVDCNVFEVLNVSVNAFRDIIQNDPVTVLASFVEDRDLAERWKMSGEDRKLFEFLMNMKDCSYDIKTAKTDIAVYAMKLSQKCWMEYFAIRNMQEEFDIMGKWTVPSFPVSGNDLIQIGERPSRAFGNTMILLKKTWANNDFTLDKQALLAILKSKK